MVFKLIFNDINILDNKRYDMVNNLIKSGKYTLDLPVEAKKIVKMT